MLLVKYSFGKVRDVSTEKDAKGHLINFSSFLCDIQYLLELFFSVAETFLFNIKII